MARVRIDQILLARGHPRVDGDLLEPQRLGERDRLRVGAGERGLDLGGDPSLQKTRALLDDVAAHGLNHVVMNVYAHDVGWTTEGRGTRHDYSAPRLWPFGGTNDEPQHERLSPEFFRHLDRVLKGDLDLFLRPEALS